MTDSAEPTDVARSPNSRRDFLKILGASGAATAAIGCSSDRVEKLIPYLVHPDETVPGVSNFYASTCRECSAGCGLLLETRDGRTFNLEGNPDHPLSRGALCARGQAAVQGLYNPDRYRGPMMRRSGRHADSPDPRPARRRRGHRRESCVVRRLMAVAKLRRRPPHRLLRRRLPR